MTIDKKTTTAQTGHDDHSPCGNPRRALIKMATIICTALVIITILSQLVTDSSLDALKHHLSLWTIIALVIIINLVSFICFMILYAAYRWVKGDLKPPREDGLPK